MPNLQIFVQFLIINRIMYQDIHDIIDFVTWQVTVYRRRWYILILFSLVAATQGGIWNTWGPIAASSECVFGWSDATVALMTNWGPITYIIGESGKMCQGEKSIFQPKMCNMIGGIGACWAKNSPGQVWLVRKGDVECSVYSCVLKLHAMFFKIQCSDLPQRAGVEFSDPQINS